MAIGQKYNPYVTANSNQARINALNAQQAQDRAAQTSRNAATQARVDAMDAAKSSGGGSYERLVASINADRQRQAQAQAQQKLVSSTISASNQARQANVARQARIEGMYGEMLKSVGRGGAFEKAGLADIEEARVKGVGEETQSMISSGVYGTTTAAGVPAKHRKIATQARLKLEDVMSQRELAIKQQKIGFLERIEDTYPDYSQLLSSLAR